MNPGPLTDYKPLRKINIQVARQAVIEYLKANGRNISQAARAFGITRPLDAPQHRIAKSPDL
jgi:hypothetical protein